MSNPTAEILSKLAEGAIDGIEALVRTIIILFALLVVAILALVGIGAYWFFS
jgi:hypothetical protein